VVPPAHEEEQVVHQHLLHRRRHVVAVVVTSAPLPLLLRVRKAASGLLIGRRLGLGRCRRRRHALRVCSAATRLVAPRRRRLPLVVVVAAGVVVGRRRRLLALALGEVRSVVEGGERHGHQVVRQWWGRSRRLWRGLELPRAASRALGRGRLRQLQGGAGPVCSDGATFVVALVVIFVILFLLLLLVVVVIVIVIFV
jgi:hypothetical protein